MSMSPAIMATKGLIIDIRMGRNGMRKEILYKNLEQYLGRQYKREYRCFQEQYWNRFSVLVRT